MNTSEKAVNMEEMRVKLSTLWIFVLLNMIFADIVGFIEPGALEKMMAGDLGVDITPGLLLIFSLLLEIPIAMVILSRILEYKANRRANIIAGVTTILYVIGGGNISVSYIFFATMEIVGMLFIIWSAWKWTPGVRNEL